MSKNNTSISSSIKKKWYLLYFYYFKSLFSRSTVSVSHDHLLVGTQAGFELLDWINVSKEYSRISLPLPQSPYVHFLQEVDKDPSLLEDAARMKNTDYFQMGWICIATVGSYMGATDEIQLIDWMKQYYNRYLESKAGTLNADFTPRQGQSKKGGAIVLKKIKRSNGYYEIIDGHHRAAISYLLKENTIKGKVITMNYSALQKMLLQVNQINDIELYQPVDRVEVATWPAVRNCQDRYEMMSKALNDLNIKSGTFLDLACSYGSFPRSFKKLGFTVTGLDRDRSALDIAQHINGLLPEEIVHEKMEFFLKEMISAQKQFDVVLCLSILHHYALGKENESVEVILQSLDKITGKVLFLDTGQNHEAWFKSKLSQWDEAYIVDIIKKNTSFSQVIALGTDKDNVGKYKNNYRRTLFACIK